jgi:hypothetical protein
LHVHLFCCKFDIFLFESLDIPFIVFIFYFTITKGGKKAIMIANGGEMDIASLIFLTPCPVRRKRGRTLMARSRGPVFARGCLLILGR